MAGAVKADFPCGGLHAYGHAARSGTPMGSCMWGGAVRRFACGSPAVIESSPPMGALASQCGFALRVIYRRMGYPLRRDAVNSG